MPAPQKNMMSQLARMLFISKFIMLPTDWSDMGSQYPNAFKPEELIVPPNSPMNLFREVSLNKYHVDTAKKIGEQFGEFIDGISGAICDGIDKWMKMTTITGVIINGPVGMLTPGMVVGPPLMPLILATAPKSTPQQLKYSMAIANTFGTLWQPWQLGISGVIMFPPTFAVFPGPFHPPTPNIPMPLIALPSPGESG